MKPQDPLTTIHCSPRQTASNEIEITNKEVKPKQESHIEERRQQGKIKT